MSMLGEQIKELHEMADAMHRRSREIGLDYGMGRGLADASRMLREAADTIESLRDRLQENECECADVAEEYNQWQCSECGAEAVLYDVEMYPLLRMGRDWFSPRYCPWCGRKAVDE